MPSFQTSDGLRVDYHIDDYTDPWRKPDDVLMLHSAMGRATRYYSMVPTLARHFRVVRVDLRGHGDTQVPPAEQALTFERLLLDTTELLDHLAIERAHIIGNSAGGYIGQQLAFNRAERVKSLILFGSAPGLKNSQAPSWVAGVGRMGMRPFFKETIRDRVPPEDVDPAFVEWFLDEIAHNDVPFIAKWVLYMASFDWSDQLHRIKCPTLLVVPGAEPVGSVDNYEPMRKNIPDVEMIVYEGARHNICDYMPDRCAADALAFLAKRFGGVNAHSPRYKA